MELVLIAVVAVVIVAVFVSKPASRSSKGRAEKPVYTSESAKERAQLERQYKRYEEWDRNRRAEGHEDSAPKRKRLTLDHSKAPTPKPSVPKLQGRAGAPGSLSAIPSNGYHGGIPRMDDEFRIRAVGSTRWVVLPLTKTQEFTVVGTDHFPARVKRLKKSTALSVSLGFLPNPHNPTAVAAYHNGQQIGWLSRTWHEPNSPTVAFVKRFERVAGKPLFDAWVDKDGWIRVRLPDKNSLDEVLSHFR